MISVTRMHCSSVDRLSFALAVRSREYDSRTAAMATSMQ